VIDIRPSSAFSRRLLVAIALRPYDLCMSVEDDLLEACRLAPDDDAPCLVWADAVGGERGELIVIQCDLAGRALAC
jgi:hypothetical protein